MPLLILMHLLLITGPLPSHLALSLLQLPNLPIIILNL